MTTLIFMTLMLSSFTCALCALVEGIRGESGIETTSIPRTCNHSVPEKSQERMDLELEAKNELDLLDDLGCQTTTEIYARYREEMKRNNGGTVPTTL